MTDLKSRADELIDRSHLDTSAASWDRMNSEDYTEATRPSRAALTRFVHALCECAEALKKLVAAEQTIVGSPEYATYFQRYGDAMSNARAALSALEKGEKA